MMSAMLVAAAAAFTAPAPVRRHVHSGRGAPSPAMAAAAEMTDLPTPGMAENSRFSLDESVALWADFQRDGPDSVLDNLRAASQIASRYVASGPGAAAYWAKHAARTSYFLSNAVAGTVAFVLSRELERLRPGSSAPPGEGLGIGDLTDLTNGQVTSRLLLEATMTYEADWKHISAGAHREPWDLTAGHRQTSPLYAARQSARFVAEAVATLGRFSRGGEEDRTIWLDTDAVYPSYYKNNFHYQVRANPDPNPHPSPNPTPNPTPNPNPNPNP